MLFDSCILRLSFNVSFRLSLPVCNCLLMLLLPTGFRFCLPIRFPLSLCRPLLLQAAARCPPATRIIFSKSTEKRTAQFLKNNEK
ncbi:hypothetical protein [Methanimicrococcus hongohii]|uniref:hypothetical protein n=1 Tax=Methanimicrococcus hongohii TaxID=3028295 RepID=UPI002931F52A|nr:hypothetical protein [Methanimicrococcus sp. Hf6]